MRTTPRFLLRARLAVSGAAFGAAFGAACGLAVPIAAAPLGAQTVTGIVSDSANGRGIPGAVVQLLDADGNLRSRVVSGARGEYLLRATATATQLRVVRIGYRPASLSLPASPPGAAPIRLDIPLAPLSAFLTPIRVTAAQCPRRRGRESPAQLIEQARAGLLATVVSRESNPATVRRYGFEREFAPMSNDIAWQRVQLEAAENVTQTFSAADDAAGFVRRGFFDSETGTYFAPDADVLLDARFAAGYCFRVMPAQRDRPHQVGLGFEAADTRPGRVDVDGALWIDTLARELRDIEFRYVGMNRVINAYRPGGRLMFRAVPNGSVIVEWWVLRLIGIDDDTLSGSRPGGPRNPRRIIVRERGGVLGGATWRDGSEWQPQLAAVRGLARWADDTPAANVGILLPGTPYRATTDSAGRFVIGGLVEGPYSIVAVEPRLWSVGLTVPSGFTLTVARDTVPVVLSLPTVPSLIAQACAQERRGPSTVPSSSAASGTPPSAPPGAATSAADSLRAFVLGRAMQDDGRAIADATWSLQLDRGAGFEEIAKDGKTGSDGLMPYCALPRGALLEFVVTAPDGRRQTQQVRLSERANIVPVVFAAP